LTFSAAVRRFLDPLRELWESRHMNFLNRAPLFGAFLLLLSPVNSALSQTNVPIEFNHSDRLQAIVDRAAREAFTKFAEKKLATNQLALTLVDLRDLEKPAWASVRGGEQIYPASVIKMFYLVAAHRWMEDGKLANTGELRRAMRDMIVDSLNEATGYLVDLLTDTTSGPELSPDKMEKWYDKRNAVNRCFASLGYQNINVNRKPWCEGPYGREMQSVKLHQPNHRNWLTTDATARLLAEIVTGRAVTPERSQQMMELLKRRPFDKDAELQSREYTGAALPPESKLWSKAGWTSEVRHDAAYVELPTGEKFVLVVFSVGHSNDKEIIPTVAKAVIAGLTSGK
jgi:beta-lactamase class A